MRKIVGGQGDKKFTVKTMTAIYEGEDVVGFVPSGAITQERIAQDKSLRIEENVYVLTDGKRGVPLGKSAEIILGGDDIIREIISSG